MIGFPVYFLLGYKLLINLGLEYSVILNNTKVASQVKLAAF